ncbi:hypothetical protein [Amycolatopsis sp. NPDC059657]|uniref:hypothetical protein n=1 Tax=Amycolatopsis sp. NPDC059657 TaxID=3346899 RepID=UPI003670EF52
MPENLSPHVRAASGMDSAAPAPRSWPIDAFAHLEASLRQIKTEQARLGKERKEHETALKAHLRAAGARVGTVRGVPVVSFMPSLRIALDQNVLKEKYPEIAQECTDISEVWTFRLLDA